MFFRAVRLMLFTFAVLAPNLQKTAALHLHCALSATAFISPEGESLLRSSLLISV
uniref:Uncharacterized protein n=1 Tax=Anguilla anguilla TaxID=7936 RepID=A0A0E9UHU9_ANGAN